MYHFFTHSTIIGFLDCFQILAIVNNVAVYVGVQISFQVSAFVLLELLDHIVVLVVPFEVSPYCFHSSCTSYIPTSSTQGFPFLRILTNTCYFLLLVIAILTCVTHLHINMCNTLTHFNMCKVISNCGFHFLSPDY